jgi:hypothetical protein
MQSFTATAEAECLAVDAREGGFVTLDTGNARELIGPIGNYYLTRDATVCSNERAHEVGRIIGDKHRRVMAHTVDVSG